MSRARIAGVLVAAAVFAALLAWRMGETAPAPEESAPPIGVAIVEPGRSQSQAKSLGRVAELPPSESQPSAENLEQRFNDAADLLAFVESVLAAAKAGDGPSAYWISHAIQRCDTEYKVYFHRRGRIVTLDEALQINASNPFVPLDETRKLHAQCARMRESDYMGKQKELDWLSAAASAGMPLARAELARVLVLDSTRRSGCGDENCELGQQLAMAALRSKDPAVFVVIGDVMAALNRSEPDGRENGWLLAACQRGLDCSPGSALVEFFCRGDRNCQPYEDLPSVLRRNLGEEYDEFERRAHEINQYVDQDRFEELGFTVTAPAPG
jgi:hypothetical protein